MSKINGRFILLCGTILCFFNLSCSSNFTPTIPATSTPFITPTLITILPSPSPGAIQIIGNDDKNIGNSGSNIGNTTITNNQVVTNVITGGNPTLCNFCNEGKPTPTEAPKAIILTEIQNHWKLVYKDDFSKPLSWYTGIYTDGSHGILKAYFNDHNYILAVKANDTGGITGTNTSSFLTGRSFDSFYASVYVSNIAGPVDSRCGIAFGYAENPQRYFLFQIEPQRQLYHLASIKPNVDDPKVRGYPFDKFISNVEYSYIKNQLNADNKIAVKVNAGPDVSEVKLYINDVEVNSVPVFAPVHGDLELTAQAVNPTGFVACQFHDFNVFTESK